MIDKLDIMDLRHQSIAMCICWEGAGEDTHPWPATNVVNPTLATIPVEPEQKIPTNKLLIPATIPVGW